MSAHVTAAAVWTGEELRFTDLINSKVLRKLKPAAGECFVVRVEREDDAKKHHQLKWFYGFIVKQASEATGYTVKETDDMFRALYMPPDVKTLSDMSYRQMADFNTQCEAYAAETIGVVIVGPDDARHYQQP